MRLKKENKAEILVVYDSIFAASKQNLVKRQFPYLNMFNHEGPVGAIRAESDRRKSVV